ncbi:hypothetical protein CCACVL1_02893, partial [Corchorus capsularis]
DLSGPISDCFEFVFDFANHKAFLQIVYGLTIIIL